MQDAPEGHPLQTYDIIPVGDRGCIRGSCKAVASPKRNMCRPLLNTRLSPMLASVFTANMGLLYGLYTQVFGKPARIYSRGIHMCGIELLCLLDSEIVGNLHNDRNGILFLYGKHQAVAAGELAAKQYGQFIF